MPWSSSSGEGFRSPSSHSHCRGKRTGSRQSLLDLPSPSNIAWRAPGQPRDALTGKDLNTKANRASFWHGHVRTGQQREGSASLVFWEHFLVLRFHLIAATSPVTEQGAGMTAQSLGRRIKKCTKPGPCSREEALGMAESLLRLTSESGNI